MGTFLLPGRTLPGKCIILADSATYILFLVHGHLSYPRYISNLKKRKLLQALLNPVSSLLFHDLFSFIVIFLKTTTNRIIHENFYSLVILLPPDPHTNHSLMTSPATPHPHHLLHFRPTFPTARTPLLFPASSILLTNWFLTFYIFFKNHLSWCNQRDTFLRERSNDINSLTTLCLLKISLIGDSKIWSFQHFLPLCITMYLICQTQIQIYTLLWPHDILTCPCVLFKLLLYITLPTPKS